MAEISVKNVILEWLFGSAINFAKIGDWWRTIRALYIVPIVRVSLYICLVMSTMLLLEWFYIGAVFIYVKLFRRTPQKRYKWEPFGEDSETANADFPMVLVQIPLFNEKEVYKLSIGAACNLSWPADRLLIQVVDGSTDILIKDMIEKECRRWASQGVNIRHQVRETSGGFKAGALKEGLDYNYVKECVYVAVFDADFQPPPNFLLRAVPFLIHNPDLALVQARWRFVNVDECLLTRFQEIYLDYHFTCEQEVGSSNYAFFGFNGSGGIWKIAAINDAGGWDARTTAEDMDIAVRAALKGWKLVYVGDLEVNSELPSTFEAFRLQQHRWSCGPSNLFRKVFTDIARNKKVSIWKKCYMIYNFFFVRKILGHMCIFFSYCIVLPLTILIPEVTVPKGGAVFIPCILAAINCIFATPRSLHLVFLWILFENTMSVLLTKAVFTGLFGTRSSNEWIVTAKHGDSCTQNMTNIDSTEPHKPLFEVLRNRILLPELGFAVFLFISGWQTKVRALAERELLICTVALRIILSC
ncbi:glucomannan 4-beta-mannosyltransferase 2-like isoform X2 [Andrographis paniculata]|uniref:glucomannan 4-beta-mannosyltransferase 2-like isoform X2 n=1 Tax=Andrographis paniculata TaxID=175694 RepID=UPI0021E8B4F8|nr:glucomannan 4-beta-mannosyltransferase 2-like isoform X2 [Andrographis paniculata]